MHLVGGSVHRRVQVDRLRFIQLFRAVWHCGKQLRLLLALRTHQLQGISAPPPIASNGSSRWMHGRGAYIQMLVGPILKRLVLVLLQQPVLPALQAVMPPVMLACAHACNWDHAVVQSLA